VPQFVPPKKKKLSPTPELPAAIAFTTSASYRFCVLRFAAKSTGANPTIESYNASAVKIYNATSSLVRFKDIIFCSTFEKTL
jgi:hypothetical protein